LVTSAPRGQTLNEKIKAMIPEEALNHRINGTTLRELLDRLPSFGGDWEQYFEIEMRWNDE